MARLWKRFFKGSAEAAAAPAKDEYGMPRRPAELRFAPPIGARLEPQGARRLEGPGQDRQAAETRSLFFPPPAA